MAGALALVAACGGGGTEEPARPAPVEEDGEAGRERPADPLPEAIAPRVQLLFRECSDGDVDSCRELAALAPAGSAEQRFGATCGDRRHEGACGR